MAVTTSAPDRTTTPDQDEALRAQQIRPAEGPLFSGPAPPRVPEGPFRCGVPRGGGLPSPQLPRRARATVGDAVAAVRAFAETQIDAPAIDREAAIPASVIQGLAELGVLGMAAPEEWGGRGFSQMAYCRIMEVIGGHCAATAVFVN